MAGSRQPVPVLAKLGLATIAFGLASDLVEHSLAMPAAATAGSGGLPSGPLMMEPGQSASRAFAGLGVCHYQCHLHPQDMQGSVTVES